MRQRCITYILVLILIAVIGQNEAIASTYHIDNLKQMYTYEQMTADIQQLAKDYPGLLEYYSLGKTNYGRDIWAVRLGYGEAITLVTASTHAREWVTTNVVMKQLQTYTKAYTNSEKVKNQNVKEILDNTTIWFVPMVNPDGVTLQQKGLDAFPKEVHEKLIKINEGSTDFKRWKANADGYDPNRNYDVDHHLIESPDSPSWNNYKGEYPNQIIETKVISELSEKLNPEMLIAYHTAGEILYWEYKADPVIRVRDLEIAKTVSSITGYSLMVNTNRPTGSHMDWFLTKFQRPAFTPELGKHPGQTNVPISSFDRIWQQNEILPLYIAKESYKFWLEKQPVQNINLKINLLSSSKLYSSPLVDSASYLNAQKLTVVAEKGNLWKVKTWNGEMWLPKRYTEEIITNGFIDFEENKYWSDSMLWAAERGLIVGVTHNKRQYLKPLDYLTEAQFLTILFRLTVPKELEMEEPIQSSWSSSTYQLAHKYGLLTKGTLEKLSNGDINITRGEMAQLLVSYHLNNPTISIEEAVQFLYDNHISVGYDATNKTLENFGPNDLLQRGQIAKFMQNYEKLLMKKNE